MTMTLPPEATAPSSPTKATTAPAEESGRCGGGVWRALAECAAGLCEPLGPIEETGHMLLARMHEEREQQLAAEQAAAEERRRAQEIAAKQWEEELAQIQARRANMDAEELEQDCIAHFACSVLLQPGAIDDSAAGSAQSPTSCRRLGSMKSIASSKTFAVEADEDEEDDEEETELDEPRCAFERWLVDRLKAQPSPGADCAQSDAEGGCADNRWVSFGELPDAACGDLADSLAAALRQSAQEADDTAATLEGRAEEETGPGEFSDQFDEILRRYAAESEKAEEDGGNDKGHPEVCSSSVRDDAILGRALRAKAQRYRAVADRVDALAPTLHGDAASARTVAALAVLDLVDFVSAGGDDEAGAGRFVEPGGAEAADFRSFRAPVRAMSSADVCWALCSEKRRLILERMLPGMGADGRWDWPQVRRTCVGWWLCGIGAGTHYARHVPAPEVGLADTIVANLWRSAMTSLRAFEKTGRLPGNTAKVEEPDTKRIGRQLTDEVVFWYALMGTTLTKLRALLKTGALSSEPALQQLFSHERSEEPEFMRKNAFRLLQLHRYHLAVALFVLSDSYEEAARVVVSHLRDLQLLLVLLRRQPQLSLPLLREHVSGLSPKERADPWLRALLEWQMGGEAERAAPNIGDGAGVMPDLDTPPVELEPLFDAAVRLSAAGASPGGDGDRTGLDRVSSMLRGVAA
mmetsp:Transcript_58873/g.170280  ORF Transcript_58873/g.170280 Transcript_58873/m.170280 type:complete len:693 (-) Transcript_58873:192-2270(-)